MPKSNFHLTWFPIGIRKGPTIGPSELTTLIEIVSTDPHLIAHSDTRRLQFGIYKQIARFKLFITRDCFKFLILYFQASLCSHLCVDHKQIKASAKSKNGRTIGIVQNQINKVCATYFMFLNSFC